MTKCDFIPSKVHFVGSVGLGSTEEIFHTAGSLLGRRLARIPDGEPGGRSVWISWQYPVLMANPSLKMDLSQSNRTGLPLIRLREDADPNELHFNELGYAREARASYQDFLEAKERGDLAEETRFQISLPTPMAVVTSLCLSDDHAAIEPAYEAAMIREVQVVCNAIPHNDLCIQWDICIEMIIWDGRLEFLKSPVSDFKSAFNERITRLCAAIPEQVELGFHLCYGDWEGKHFIQPLDTGKLVEVANVLADNISHRIAYIHMPVPQDRGDPDYFKPLRDLNLKPDTELYLGLVHRDGVDETRHRIAAASQVVADFGIATECGIARARTTEIVKELLKIHAEATQEPKETQDH